MALQQRPAQQIVCPACRTIFNAAGVPAGKRLRCTRCDHRFTLPPPPAPRPVAIPVSAGPARPVAIPVSVRSGMKIGWIAAALLLAAGLVGGSILVATQFRKPQSHAAPGVGVALHGGASSSGGDDRPRESMTGAGRDDTQGNPGAKDEAAEKRGDTAKGREPLPGKPVPSNAKQLAKQRLDEAEIAYKQARALYDADYRRYEGEQRLALAQNGNRGAMGLPPLMVRPVDPVLSARMNGAFQLYQEAKRAYEATNAE